ncbi:transketolase [Caldicoprobacter guelmensis]|uniref:transketolase n=1 Tax=Caldicoprobacter guelmensis TaxID=1170224 RepID=UPI00195945D3|nr:transketolase [Caldicoprobacter guelmensis]MBM7583418.1 transketolase [Caldicoprobacter guelmensis]
MFPIEEIKRAAQEARITVINMIYKAGSGHIGGSLSCAEIITVLYECFLNVKPEEPLWPERDRFILSKGHAAPMLYAILSRKGFFEQSQLDTLRKLNSNLQGHPCMFKLPGIDMSTGSLGMGVSVGVGMALAAKLTKRNFRVFVLCGDGELQEGQNWEAFMSAAKWKLDNLIVIIDKNGVQLDGKVEEVMPLGDLEAKLKAFGIYVLNCDGHNVEALINSIQEAINYKGPAAVIANTVKGKGVSFMEGQSLWHGKPINKEEYEQAIMELSKCF